MEPVTHISIYRFVQLERFSINSKWDPLSFRASSFKTVNVLRSTRGLKRHEVFIEVSKEVQKKMKEIVFQALYLKIS